MSRTVWIVAQRNPRPGVAKFLWYRRPDVATRDLLRCIESNPHGTFIFLSFEVDEPSVDYNDDDAVAEWLGDFDPW